MAKSKGKIIGWSIAGLLGLLVFAGVLLVGPSRLLMWGQTIINTQCDGKVVYVERDFNSDAPPQQRRCTITVYNDAVVGSYVLSVQGQSYHFLNTWHIQDNGVYVNGTLGTHLPVIIDELVEKNPPVKTLILGDVPGSADDEVVMPSIMRLHRLGYSTHVTANSHITSGGVDLFSGGVRRTAEKGAKVGVHAWADSLYSQFVADGDEDRIIASQLPKDSPEHSKYLELYEYTGVPAAFYWYTLSAAPAESMHYMSDADIQRFLTTE